MEPSGLLLFGMTFGGVLSILALLWFISRVKAFLRGEPFLTARRFQRAGESVKSYPTPAPIVTSSAEVAAPRSAPSSLQTDDRQTDRQSAQSKPSAEQLLTLYALLRSKGTGREEARAALKAIGLPLDNNLWAKAAPQPAPTDDDLTVTPIAGRVTRASFYQDDQELSYQPPPR